MSDELQHEVEELEANIVATTADKADSKTETPSAANRRQYKRAAITRGVRIFLSDGSSVYAKIVNLSIAGVGIVYDMPAEHGAKLRLEFSLVGDNDVLDSISTQAVVRHTHLVNNRYYIGMQFVDMDEDTTEVIKLHVAQHSIRNLSIIK